MIRLERNGANELIRANTGETGSPVTPADSYARVVDAHVGMAFVAGEWIYGEDVGFHDEWNVKAQWRAQSPRVDVYLQCGCESEPVDVVSHWHIGIK